MQQPSLALTCPDHITLQALLTQRLANSLDLAWLHQTGLAQGAHGAHIHLSEWWEPYLLAPSPTLRGSCIGHTAGTLVLPGEYAWSQPTHAILTAPRVAHVPKLSLLITTKLESHCLSNPKSTVSIWRIDQLTHTWFEINQDWTIKTKTNFYPKEAA